MNTELLQGQVKEKFDAALKKVTTIEELEQLRVEYAGKKGFITGGYVCATNLIDVKTLGAELGANTVVEIGINPETKRRYNELEAQLQEDAKLLRSAQPVLDAAKAKILSGIKLPPEQVKHM